jgi:hypothetical protein
MLVTRSRLVCFTLLLGALTACGSDPEPTAATATQAAQPGTPSPTGITPTAPGTEATPSSVRTPAPSAATGCPATDPTNVARPGTVHERDVRTAETWTLAGSPHRLPDGLSIASGAVLTIEPCTRIIVGDAFWVSVEDGGTLLAVGQPGKPILFDSSATSDVRGLWHGIAFSANARPDSKLHYVVIEEAGGDGGYPAALFLHDNIAIDVQHVQILRSKRHGVFLGGSSRFATSAIDLVVTASGVAEELSFPVCFAGANSVGSLPAGKYDGNVTNEIGVENKDVSASATWRNPGAGVRYRLLEGIQVEGPAGAVLTVAPGTVLAFAAGKTLWVGWGGDGGLVLDGGNDASRIVLTSARPVPDAGDWAGIHFGEHVSRAATKLAYVTIQYAGGTDGYDDIGCGDPVPASITISTRDLGPRIDHVKFESLEPASIAIARNFEAAQATDYTAAALGMDFGGGQRCKQSLNRGTGGQCPDPVPACR